MGWIFLRKPKDFCARLRISALSNKYFRTHVIVFRHIKYIYFGRKTFLRTVQTFLRTVKTFLHTVKMFLRTCDDKSYFLRKHVNFRNTSPIGPPYSNALPPFSIILIPTASYLACLNSFYDLSLCLVPVWNLSLLLLIPVPFHEK